MARDELSLFSYEILGLVGRGGVSAHDLKRMVERGRLLAWAGESQYYSEPKRLARLGYLEAHSEPGKTRERTVYELTEKGRGALREFAKRPLHVTPLKSEPLVRLLIADLVDKRTTRTSFATLRKDIEELRSRLDEARASAETLPERREYLLLTNDFLGRLLDLYEDLADEVARG
jgi:PadR family transcriptional regulator, regulatory protein AphA